MAKKKQTKKHRFKYTEPSVAAGLELGAGRATNIETKNGAAALSRSAATARLAQGARDFSYVGVDVRRIAVFAVCLVAVEVVLWYLFGHTGFGTTVYNSFNVN